MDWLIDINGMSICEGLFYAYVKELCSYYVHI